MNTFEPKDIDNKIIKAKKYLKSLSSNFQTNFFNIENDIDNEVQEINNLIQQKKQIIPEINYINIKNKSIDLEVINLIKKRLTRGANSIKVCQI